MTKWLYKRILRKLSLSLEQRAELSRRLTLTNICAGPFLREGKMCPNTTALSLKLGRGLNNSEIRPLLRQYGINSLELALFYVFFDIPAMISKRLFEKSLQALRAATKEL